MSDDVKRYTERELVMAKREGFCAGVEAHAHRQIHDVAYARTLAGIRYPLPRVTRPRVVRDLHNDAWEVRESILWCQGNPIGWADKTTLQKLLDLIDNPNETVDTE